MQKATIFISGIIGQDTTLLDVIRQFKSFENPTEVEAIINSVGGNVDQGQSIFTYLRNLKLPITTIAEKAYSIAASIFMAGDDRIVKEGEKVLMVHMPWANNVSGNSKQLDAYSKQLKEIDKSFVEFYGKYLDLDKATIQNLLESEIFLSSKEAIELGFAHKESAPLQAVAQFDPQPTDSESMTITETLAAIANKLNIKAENKPEIVALMVQTVAGIEVNFPDLQENESPSVGDSAQVDGQPAEGEHVMPNGETYVFEGGQLTEIKEAEPAEEEETAPSQDEEIEALIKKIETSIENKFKASYGKKLEDQEAEIVALKKLIGTSDIEISAQEQPKKQTKSYLR